MSEVLAVWPVPPTGASSSASPGRARQTDISRLLGLHTRGATWIVVAFVVSNVLFVASTADLLDRVWASWVAVALVSAGGVMVTRPHPDPFPMGLTVMVLAIVVVSSGLVCVALPDSGTLGRSTWHLGSNTWLLWFLILRRRVGWAWAGGLAMLAVTMAWAALSGRGAWWGLSLASAQVLLLVIATLFGRALRTSSRRINSLAQRSVDAAAAAGAVEAARSVQDARADELAAMVVPSLELIASGAALSAAQREEITRVEAQLRDSVRGRGLALSQIVAAAGQARARGVEVTLLDDLGVPLSPDEAGAVIDAVVGALDAAVDGSVTARLLPVGREDILTLVSQGAHGVEWGAVPRGAHG